MSLQDLERQGVNVEESCFLNKQVYDEVQLARSTTTVQLWNGIMEANSESNFLVHILLEVN